MVPDCDLYLLLRTPGGQGRSPWKNDIPAYLFLGGLAAGSSLLAAGAGLHRRPGCAPRQPHRSVVGITAGTAALIHDLGKPGAS